MSSQPEYEAAEFAAPEFQSSSFPSQSCSKTRTYLAEIEQHRHKSRNSGGDGSLEDTPPEVIDCWPFETPEALVETLWLYQKNERKNHVVLLFFINYAALLVEIIVYTEYIVTRRYLDGKKNDISIETIFVQSQCQYIRKLIEC